MRKSKRIAVALVAGFLALLMVMSVILSILGTASAVTQSQIDELKENAAALQSQQAAIQAQIDSRNDDLMASMAKYELLEQQMDVTRQQIDNISAQIVACEELIVEKQGEYEDAVDAEATQLQHLKTRVRAMEENGTVVSYIEILFQATSFSDLLARIDLIAAIMDSDQKLADELEQARLDVAAAKREVEATKAEYEVMLSEQETRKGELEVSMTEANELMDYLQANIDELNASYEANENEEAQLQAEIDELVAELIEQQRAEEEARRQQQSGGSGGGSSGYVGTTGSGQYIWPATSTYVTSPFGTRWHPVTGGYKVHYGIDIGASYGTNIYAADSGSVVISTYSSSYGNYVMIDHGNGNSTLYAHMSTRYVSVGDSVSQGDVIGLIGSTGMSTGPHLHFEIRENGSRVDPMGYFS